MAFFKCKMCGGTIEFEQGATVGVCDSCGTKQTLPRLDNDKKSNLYGRADHFRRNNDFDKAMSIYEQILNEEDNDAEAYWSLVLCRYGIEYVEDPVSHKRIPTVHRAQYTSVLADEDYKSALKYADKSQKEIYESEARAIEEIQKGILAISQNEEPFDIFICYKESDAEGKRTPDSVLANDLYYQLTEEGFKVFFARITLEDKLGSAYEPYIFAALNSAKVMVVLGTKPEYFNAVWVKNEWSRYLSLIRNGAKKVLIPAYRDMDPYDLPEEFSHLQAQDMSKLGFMQDLIRGIRKIMGIDDRKTTPTASNYNNNNSGEGNELAPLLKRASMYMEDGDWEEADECFERALDKDPECVQAYLGKLMVENHVTRKEQLKDCNEPFDDSYYYPKVLRFADETLKENLASYNKYIRERNEKTRTKSIYDNAVKMMKSANSEAAFKTAAESFKRISGYMDADSLAGQCLISAESSRKKDIYAAGLSQMNTNKVEGLNAAIKYFESIPGWKDADELVRKCRQKIEEIQRKEKEARQEADRKIKKARRKAKTGKLIVRLIILAIILGIGYSIYNKKVLAPKKEYAAAEELYDNGKYEEAFEAFNSMDYQNSKGMAMQSLFGLSLDYFEDGKYDEALKVFTSHSFTDSKNELPGFKYDLANALYNKGEYSRAADLYSTIDFEDSADKASLSLYQCAVPLYDEGKYADAFKFFNLSSYNDSAEKAQECIFIEQSAKLTNLKRGDTFKFGLYEQDNSVKNGKEEIEWIVLEVKDKKALVISKYGLDCQKFNSTETYINWDECSLRKWLNENFIKDAFGSKHQELINVSKVEEHKNPRMNPKYGEDTEDKVFLLSIVEAGEYFNSDEERKCAPTEYAKARGASTDKKEKTTNGEATGVWWLRTPGAGSDHACTVENNGELESWGWLVNDDEGSVRPAMWITLK